MNFKSSILSRAFPLSLGLAVSIVLIARICFDFSFDNFYKDADRIFIIRSEAVIQGKAFEYPQVSGAVAPGFRQYVPGVEEATRLSTIFESDEYIIQKSGADVYVDGESVIADTSFFRIFDRKIIAGDPSQVLSVPAMAMISSSFAEKLGGVEKAVGLIIQNTDAPGIDITVGGVFEDFPKNGLMDIDVMISMSSYYSSSTENWVGNDRYAGYVRLEDGVDPSDLDDAIRLMQEKNQPLDELAQQGISVRYSLFPLDRLHTSDKEIRNSMLLLSIIVLLLMGISILNYALSVISSAVDRSRDFAVRKCFGADGWNIYGSLFSDAAWTVLSALIMASVILTAGSGFIRDVMGVGIEDMMVPMSYIAVSAMIIIVLLITALIPGRIYMRVPVYTAIRNFSDARRNWKYVLLTIQFVINTFMFGMLVIFDGQYHKVLNEDTGYDYSNVFYVNTTGMEQKDIITSADILSKVAGIDGVLMLTELPMTHSSGNMISLPGSVKQLFNIADQYFGSPGFFDFFRIPVIDGKEPSTPYEVAVSRSFVEQMSEFAEWSDGAVGKQIVISEHSDDPFTISGVYEDYLVGSYRYRDGRPSVRFTGDVDSYAKYNYVLFRTDRLDDRIVKDVESAFRSNGSMRIFSYEDEMRNLYSDNRKMRDTFIAGGIFALMISVCGLIGFVMNEALRRRKEIAVRKINGATTSDIVRMFVYDSLKMAAVAAVVGDIMIWFAAAHYLEQFDVRISVSPLHLLAADVFLCVLVIVTVVLSSMKIAVSNPSESLKNE